MILQIKNLSVQINKKIILTNINFSTTTSIVSIMGPSGSGKTTLLRCIAGLQEYNGEIYFDQKKINNIPTAKRNIGLVTQNNTLFPHLTIAENLAFPLKIRKIKPVQIQKKITQLLTELKLTALAQQLPQNISGGEQQRVAIARSLIYHPQLLLLDEPFAQLDAKLRDVLLPWLKQLVTQEKILTLFVTHNLSEAHFMSQYLLNIDHGMLK